MDARQKLTAPERIELFQRLLIQYTPPRSQHDLCRLKMYLALLESAQEMALGEA